MKARFLFAVTSQLRARENALRLRYLSQIPANTLWTPLDVDLAGSYVGLLHAEAEHTLERLVSLVLENGRDQTMRHASSRVLVNCCAVYRNAMHQALGNVGIVSPPKDLAADSGKLIEAWDELGASTYFAGRLRNNHGTGVSYVERLLHPLGVVVSARPFDKFASYGVTRLCEFAPATTTALTEFVQLRGGAMHGGLASFTAQVRSNQPTAIAQRGGAAVSFVEDVAVVLANGAW